MPEDIRAFCLAAGRLLEDGVATHAAIEDTLTSGYAHALALESERRRLERLILAAATGSELSASGWTGDAGDLADDFWRVDAQLRELRATLERLKRHQRARRVAESNGRA